jgi:uncharacterized protein
MAHPNEDLLRAGFAAFGRGDPEAVQKQSWADDIRWHFPGRNPLAGDYEGAEQVGQLFAREAELTGGTLTVELYDVLANNACAVAMVAVRGERGGKLLNDNIVIIYHIRDGKISEAWSYPADLYAEDEFWS